MADPNTPDAQPDPEPTPGPRRLPVQSPSFQTCMRIIDAASSLLRCTPLDDVTTTRIAAEADVSVGALYRFFPDKQSIIDAVAVRHVESFRSLLQLSVMPFVESQFANLRSEEHTSELQSLRHL